MLVEIELSGKCNLRCVMCPQVMGYDGRNMTLEEFNRFLPVLKNATYFTLHGAGEVLSSPIFRQVLDCMPKHLKGHFLTNGTLLTEEITNFIFDHECIDYIFVSVDKILPETYKKIRGDSLSNLLNNLNTFNNIRKYRKSKTFLKINMCVMKENIDQMVPFVLLAKSLDASCHFWPLLPDLKHRESGKWIVNRDDWTFDYEEQLLDNYDKYNNNVKICKEIGTAMGVHVEEDSFHSVDKFHEDITNCQIPLENRLYFSNGDAKHCCMQTKPLFNWHSSDLFFEKHQRHEVVLDKIKNGIIPLECSGSGCRYVQGEFSPESEDVHHKIDFRELTKKKKKNSI